MKVYNLTDYLTALRFWSYAFDLKPVEYDALSPVSFSGIVSSGNHILIFNAQFDNLWELKVGTDVIKDQWIADGFANAWSFTNEKSDTFSIRLVHYDAALLSLFGFNWGNWSDASFVMVCSILSITYTEESFNLINGGAVIEWV